jgi:hypothetical protein
LKLQELKLGKNRTFEKWDSSEFRTVLILSFSSFIFSLSLSDPALNQVRNYVAVFQVARMDLLRDLNFMIRIVQPD